MKTGAILAVLASLAVPAHVAADRPSDPAHGYWLTQNRKAVIELAPCGDETCGRTVWVETPVDPVGEPKRDVNNTDLAQRDRPICGLQLVGGLMKSGEGAWEDGWLYNPRDGATYSAAVRALSPSELKVRGYVGVKALGKSQVWTRVDGDRGGC